MLTLACAAARADNPAEVTELPQVQVVGATPLPGSGVELRRLPANAQLFTSRDLRAHGDVQAADFLDRAAASVQLNAAQGNPFQPDLQFRGFTASPLLGTPQGVSVFVDGVRVNEPFGDAVNWDLLPPSAISSLQLIPGSNPAFGFNTLGGAVAVYTKSGAAEYPKAPGGSVAVSGGSFGRRSLVAETGGTRGAWDWFVTGDRIVDDGWARHDASRVARLFGKLGWQDEDNDLDLTLHGADNRLEGAQTLPASFTDPRDAYTFPDWNVNRLAMVALKGSHALSRSLLLGGTAYVRDYRNHSLSSNVQGGDAAVPATNDAATIAQRSAGLALQLTHNGTLAGWPARRAVGVSLDRGAARLTTETQPATVGADRGIVGSGEFVPDVDADSTTRYLGAFASLALDLDARWSLSLAARLQHADVLIADRSGTAPALNGSHRFQRVNPSAGLSFQAASRWTAYASYNEGMRAPTAIELTCADPDAPCRLPNSFLADPPLQAVVARTIEAGARGRPDAPVTWSLAAYSTVADNDLQFVAAGTGATNAGYFQNVGRTRRQGVEATLSAPLGEATLTVAYSLVDATYRDPFLHHSPNNATADAEGNILVRPGDRIPGIPRHTLKLRLEAESGPFSGGVSARLASALRARGDENNADPSGRIAGHGVLDADARWRLPAGVTLFARVDNLLDARYANFGTLGQNLFAGPDHGFDPANPRLEVFRGYGAPRGAWVGIEVRR